MRADQLLVERGLAASRSQAQRLLAAGVRWRMGDAAPWQQVKKNSEDLPQAAQIELQDASEAAFVSRGGLKLQGALAATGISAAGKTCLDVGQSTGGFSDCLLQAGAAAVLGVDVGHGQLHPSLAQHPQVLALEGINARELSAEALTASILIATQAGFTPENTKNTLKNDLITALQHGFDLVVGDLSFISLSLVLPRLAPLLAAGGQLLLLVKPQFELQPADIGKGGIVRDAAKYAQVEAKIRRVCADCGLQVQAWLDSPIQGGDGNREFFVWAGRAAAPCS
ncbi:MAG: TlyA family RNA methyltransferase [Brachymonas sp.]|jgi:23S rRNA (cytidine1920-2'-O)/16S rRNA (cytidine1409-2'-O)-methyltransferase